MARLSFFHPAAVAAVAAACLAAGGCRSGEVRARSTAEAASQPGPRVVLHPPGRSVVIRVEVARADEARQRGLMYRERLSPDAGMLFLFERPEPLTFWMKNTFIPLDMIFIGPDRRIVGIVENAEPRTTTTRSVPGASQFVLEVNGGLAARIGLAKDQAVDFLNVDGA